MNLSPEKKKRNTNSSSPPPFLPPSFSLLPDDITVNYLARISRSYYPRLSIVSKSFKSLLSSTELYKERSRLRTTEDCLYFCLQQRDSQFPQWFRLWVNPNQTLPKSSVTKKKTIGQSLVPIPSLNVPSIRNSSVAVVGSEIYVIGGHLNEAPTSTVRVLDCRSHTWRNAPSMNVARARASSCVYDEKIYVLGGRIEEESWAEVFDTKTQTWEQLTNPDTEIEIPKCYISNIMEMKGKILFGNFYKMYAYDTKQSKWECCENESATFLKSECVIENVLYQCGGSYSECLCQWYDVKDGKWKEVKGLDSLPNKYKRNGGFYLVSYGGKLLLIWEEYKRGNSKDTNKIRCAEIVLEKRDGGEVWGNVERIEVVHTVPRSCHLLHCLVVSV